MTTVLAPVRYPLSDHSRRTLAEAVDIADVEDGHLIVLHINVYQEGKRRVTRSELKRAVEREFGRMENARYLIRQGFIVEQTILETVASENPDTVVIGHKQLSRWRRAVRRLFSDPDIASFLSDRIDAELVVVSPPD